MKTNFLKFKAIALSIMLVFSLFSCSDDGDDPDTFIEKNGGTVWTIAISEVVMYAKINNSESNPLEIWLGEDDSEELCYLYQSFTDIGTGVEVLENSANTFKVRVDDSETEYTILTLTVSGNLLTIQYEFYVDGELDDTELIPLQKTTEDPDDLEICEFS